MPTLIQDHAPPFLPKKRSHRGLLTPLRNWLDSIDIRHPQFAHFLCRLIPCQCAFERDVHLFGKTYHIPALCKLNPLYDELMSLRFRALAYLADVCGEDVNRYIC
ncbi:Mo-dependent nitrogenase C-terminal domain-containing protein [Leptolyngbya sp. AN02str]|uniref:Mo-dependent nitrogenase C-terminal domain-containing protein n=1 Tax=Leptolyngbya sp. AN02str TaxID=3423363 RepID=UPI003D31F892